MKPRYIFSHLVLKLNFFVTDALLFDTKNTNIKLYLWITFKKSFTD